MAEITIRYTAKVAGHPEPQSQITVERTEMVEGLLAAGYVIEVPTSPFATSDEGEKADTDG